MFFFIFIFNYCELNQKSKNVKWVVFIIYEKGLHPSPPATFSDFDSFGTCYSGSCHEIKPLRLNSPLGNFKLLHLKLKNVAQLVRPSIYLLMKNLFNC